MTDPRIEMVARCDRLLDLIERGADKEEVLKSLDFRMLMEDADWLIQVAANE